MPEAESERREKSITAFSPASQTSRVQVHRREGDKRRTKEASGPSNFQTSGGPSGEHPVISADMQTPAQNRPLSHLKMAPSSTIRPASVIDDQVGYKWKEKLYKAEQLAHSHVPGSEAFSHPSPGSANGRIKRQGPHQCPILKERLLKILKYTYLCAPPAHTSMQKQTSQVPSHPPAPNQTTVPPIKTTTASPPRSRC